MSPRPTAQLIRFPRPAERLPRVPARPVDDLAHLADLVFDAMVAEALPAGPAR